MSDRVKVGPFPGRPGTLITSLPEAMLRNTNQQPGPGNFLSASKKKIHVRYGQQPDDCLFVPL